MAKRKRSPVPQIMPQIGMAATQEANLGVAIQVAVMAAAEDGCGCRACRALRQVRDAMFDQFLPEEEEDATG